MNELLLLIALKYPAIDIDELILELRKMNKEDQEKTLKIIWGLDKWLEK